MRKKQVVLMNFSGIYETESFYETVPQENRIWLDCRTIPGTNCYCDEEGERELKERMEPLGAEGIHFLDSGNYHYVTKLWLDQVKEPFDLLVLIITQICSSPCLEIFSPAGDGFGPLWRRILI